MNCPSCSRALPSTLASRLGGSSVDVDRKTGQVRVAGEAYLLCEHCSADVAGADFTDAVDATAKFPAVEPPGAPLLYVEYHQVGRADRTWRPNTRCLSVVVTVCRVVARQDPDHAATEIQTETTVTVKHDVYVDGFVN